MLCTAERDDTDGADDRVDEDEDDDVRIDVTEFVGADARAYGFPHPPPPSESGSRLRPSRQLGGSDGRPTQNGNRRKRILASLIFSCPGSST